MCVWGGRTLDLAAAEVVPVAHVVEQLLGGAADVDAHGEAVGLHARRCRRKVARESNARPSQSGLDIPKDGDAVGFFEG